MKPSFLCLRSTVSLLGTLLVVPGARAQDSVASSEPAVLKQMSLDELTKVEVTSVSRFPEKLLDAASAVQVITSQNIRDSGATNLPEALRGADNLQIAQINGHDWAISARGFDANSSDKLLVLIDGRAVYTPLYGGVLWNVQDYLLEDISRIEVISGPGGVQWGANAMNGVINVTTKGAQDTQGLYIQQSNGGPELRDSSAVRYGGILSPGVYYRVYGEISSRGSEDLSTGGGASDTSKMARGGFRVDSAASPTTQFDVSGDAYRGTEFLGATGDEGMSGGNLTAHWSRTWADAGDFNLTAYLDHTHLSVPYATSPPTPPYVTGFPASALVDDLTTIDVDLQDRIGSERSNQVVWGLGYRRTLERDENLSIVRFAPNTLDQNLFSAFGEDRLALAPNVHLSLGTKIEHNDYTGVEVEPSARLAWNLDPKQLFWGAVSRAVRTPSRYDHDLVVPTGLVNAPAPYVFPVNYLTGSPTFKSETLLAYEIGYRTQLGDRGSTSLSTFYNVYRDLRGTTATPTTATYPFAFPIVFGNNLQAETCGAEFSSDYRLTDWWHLHAGYTVLRENVHAAAGYLDATGATSETADPKDQFSVRSSFYPLRQLQIDGDLRWVGKLMINDGPTNGPLVATIPSYCECNLRLAWQATQHLEVILVGQNLLHARHTEYGYPGPTAEAIDRTAYAKIEWRY